MPNNIISYHKYEFKANKTYFFNFQIDFNDAYYLELCRKNNWILVTSDNDFDNIDCNITIIKI